MATVSWTIMASSSSVSSLSPFSPIVSSSPSQSSQIVATCQPCVTLCTGASKLSSREAQRILFSHGSKKSLKTLKTLRRRDCQVKASVSDFPEEPVTIDNSTVLVVGGGGLGMEVVRQMATAGSWITAFQRGEKFRKEIEQLGSMLSIGDVMVPGTLDKTLRSNSFDAVVCTVGGGIQDITVDSEGVINLISAAKKAGVSRFLLVTSIGVGDSASAVDERTMQVLGPVLKEKEKAEKVLKESGLDWTIIRPGGLLSDAPTGTGILTEDNSVVGVITRADVATLILKVIFDKRAEGKTLAAIDSAKKFPPMEAKEIKEFSVA